MEKTAAFRALLLFYSNFFVHTKKGFRMEASIFRYDRHEKLFSYLAYQFGIFEDVHQLFVVLVV